MELQDQKFESLGLQKQVTGEPELVVYTRNIEGASSSKPVWLLLHGYPQTSYMWRHTIPLLPKDIPLFVPDLPGYGLSTALQQHDKLTVGSHLIKSLATLLKSTKSSSTPQPIIFIGHDRGGRISHRLSVSKDVITNNGMELLATCVIDIVPTAVQFKAFGYSAQSAVGYWHWPFLASPFGIEMVKSYGPKKFVMEMLVQISGASKENLKSGNALEVYGAAFEREGVVEATCGDYRAGAFADVDAQQEDQQAGRKVSVPLLALHGASYIAKTYNVGEVWAEWVEDPKALSTHQASDGIGHFVPEEAPEETVDAIMRWLKELGLAGKA